MSGWLTMAPAMLVAVAILVVPGCAAAWVSGLRGYALLAGSVAASLGILAAAAVVAPVVGLRWGPLPVVIGAIVVTGAALVLRWRAVSSDQTIMIVGRATNRPLSWASLVVAFAACAVLLMWGIQDPSHPSQHFDAVFHLNAVRHVIEGGSASPVDMTMAAPLQEHSVYPTLWHALVSLVVPVAGGIVPATNAVTVVVIALVWPLAVGFLAAVVWPSRVAVIAAPLLALGFGVFPFGFLNWGVLYPNLMANTLVPIVLGVIALLLRRRLGSWHQSVMLAILVALSVTGIAVAHPSAAFTVGALAIPLGAQRVTEIWRSDPTTRRRYTAAGLLMMGVAILGVLWWTASRPVGEWHPYESLSQAMGEALFLGPVLRQPALLVVLLSLIGAWAVIRRRSWWLVAGQAIAAALFVVAAWLPFAPLRGLLVGVWYEDVMRVAALLAFCALPLAAFGVHTVVRFLRRTHGARRVVAVIAIVGVLVPLGALQATILEREVSHMRTGSFAFTENSQGLTPDEVALFDKAAAIVPDGGVVAGDPLTGAGLLYAYTGQPVLFPHIKGSFGADADLLGLRLREGGEAVCEAIAHTGVTHVIDFGDRTIFPRYSESYVGLHDLADSDILTPVASVGDKVLYAVTGCG